MKQAYVYLIASFLLSTIALGQVRPITFTAILSSDQLLDPDETEGSGEIIAVLTGNQLVITGFYRDLSSPMTTPRSLPRGATIRKASVGEKGPPIRLLVEQLTLGNSSNMRLLTRDETEGRFASVFTLTNEQAEELKQGLYYVQIDTEKNPFGELRGQLTTDLVFDATAEDIVGIWQPIDDGYLFQYYEDGTWVPFSSLSEAGRSPLYLEDKWAFANNEVTVYWKIGEQTAYTELYKDGTRRYLVVEASGPSSQMVGAWYEYVLVDEKGNRLNLR